MTGRNGNPCPLCQEHVNQAGESMRRTRSGLYVVDGVRLPGPPMAGGAPPARVQGVSATGTGNVASVTATLSSTGAGNSLVAVIVCGGSGDPVAAPSGWTKRVGPITTEATATTIAYIFDRLAQPGGITSVTFANSGTANGMVGWVWEVSGVDTFDVSVSNPNQSASPISSGTTSTTTNANEFVAVLLTTHQGTTPTWSSITTGYTAETAQHTGGGATNNPSVEPCYQVVSATGTQSCSGTPSALNGGAGAIATYYAGAPPAAIPISTRQAKMTPRRV